MVQFSGFFSRTGNPPLIKSVVELVRSDAILILGKTTLNSLGGPACLAKRHSVQAVTKDWPISVGGSDMEL